MNSYDWPKDLDDSELMQQLRSELADARPNESETIKLRMARVLADELMSRWRVRCMTRDAAVPR